MQRKLVRGPRPAAPSILLHHLPNFHYYCCKFPAQLGIFLPHFWKGQVLFAATVTRLHPLWLVSPFFRGQIQILHVLQACNVKRSSFPRAGVFLWLMAAPAVPRQPGASGHSSRSPLSLCRCGCQSVPSNSVSSSFLGLFLACHAIAQGTVFGSLKRRLA